MIVRSDCRVCGGPLHPVLSLGDQYVSNFVNSPSEDGARIPLELTLCRKCYLLQLKHTAPSEQLYRNYWYKSGTNRSMTEALADIAHKAESLIKLSTGDAVLDIGCNDGTLLRQYRTEGIYKIGFDPARNLAPLSQKVANKVVVDFFDADTFLREVPEVRPKVVTSIAMFYDLEDPKRFVDGIRRVLHPDGLWVVQMSYLPLMLKHNEFGNICHEHLEYYSLKSLEFLLGLFDMSIVDLELNDVNGGSIRVYIRNAGADEECFADPTYRTLAAERLARLRSEEAAMRLDSDDPYVEFAERVHRIKGDVRSFIEDQVAKGKTVYVYGASTKGNTMLQFFELSYPTIKAAAERNPDKYGKMTVGTHIPITSEEEARAAKPDFFLVLPWHFLDEFKEREKTFLRAGGRFIVPMPQFTLI